VSLLGARRSLVALLENIDKNRYSPVVLCPKKDGELVSLLKEKGIRTEILRLRNWRKIRNIRFMPFLIYSLVRLIRKEKIELIHCNEFWLNPYGVISAKIARIPCISHVRTSLSRKKIKDYLLAYSDKIISVSEATRKPIKEYPGVFRKTAVIYNGVDTEKFNTHIKSDDIKREFGIASDETVIGTIGQLYPDKGQEVFLRAASVILKTHPKTKFFVVGEAKKERYEKQLLKITAEFKLQNQVIFAGKREDISKVLSSFDIFALPTLNEGFARVIIEAMACGKPVITTPVGGNREAVMDGKTGFIIPVNSADELARKIVELIDDKEKRIEMGKLGRERVVNHFSLEQYVKNMEGIYKEVLKYPTS
jgi:glycosyltransferase involved in cell wall biosynthesis